MVEILLKFKKEKVSEVMRVKLGAILKKCINLHA